MTGSRTDSSVVLHANIESLKLPHGKLLCQGTQLTVGCGEVCLLRAPVGWGKTVLLRLLSGWGDHIHGLEVNAEIILNGHCFHLPTDMAAYRKTARTSIACMFHQLRDESFGVTLEEEMEQIRLRYQHFAGSMPHCAQVFLANVERFDLHTRTDSIAKGVRQMLAVIDVLADVEQRQMVMLDEPSSFLASHTVHLLQELLRWTAARNPRCAVLIASHDSRAVPDKSRVMSFDIVGDDRKRQSIDLDPLRTVMRRVRSTESVSINIEGHPVAHGIRLPFRFDIAIQAGKSALITGPNGSGKTTYLLSAAGLYRVDGMYAVARADGRRIARRHVLRGWVGLVFQEPHEYEFRSQVADILRAPKSFNDTCSEAWEEFVLTVLHAYDIAPPQDPRSLSTGQLRVVWLLSQVGWCSTWLLDEIDAGLDSVAMAMVNQIILIHQECGGSVLAVTHRPELFSSGTFDEIQLGMEN